MLCLFTFTVLAFLFYSFILLIDYLKEFTFYRRMYKVTWYQYTYKIDNVQVFYWDVKPLNKNHKFIDFEIYE